MDKLYDQLCHYCIDMPSSQCEFDQNKVIQYLGLIKNEEVRHNVQNIINTTYYATWDDIKCKLNIGFNHFKQSIGQKPFILITQDQCSSRVSSESLMIYLLWKQLKLLNFQGIYYYKDDFKTKCPDVLWIDDAIYSGGSFQCMMHALDVLPSQTIHVVTAYVNGDKSQYFNGKYYDYFPIHKQVVFHTGMEIFPYNYHGSNQTQQSCLSTSKQIPLYLDYKVASFLSTYKFIYDIAYIPIDQLPLSDWTIKEQKLSVYGCLLKKRVSRKMLDDMEIIMNEIKTKIKI